MTGNTTTTTDKLQHEEVSASPSCSPTPETDGEVDHASDISLYETCGKLKSPNDVYVVTAEFCRKMERERDQARAEAEQWRDHWKNKSSMSMIAGSRLSWENA